MSRQDGLTVGDLPESVVDGVRPVNEQPQSVMNDEWKRFGVDATIPILADTRTATLLSYTEIT